MKRYFVITLSLCLFIFSIFPAQADDLSNSLQFSASIGTSGLEQDYSFAPFESRLQVGFPAGRFKTATTVNITEIQGATTTAPTGFSPASATYQIDTNADTFVPGNYFVSVVSSGSKFYKQIYFFDSNFPGNWRPLPTNENFAKNLVSTTLTLPFVRFAVFESTSALALGDASWYRYKNGLFAASPDFPQGTRLRVINKDNKKSVDVVVNDFGPDRTQQPNRVLDLDAVAFERLAPLGQGTVQVMVEVLPADVISQTPPPPPVDPNHPLISAKSAVVFNSADKKILWSQDAEEVLPLASLSKLVAIKVFLNTKPNLNKVVTYSIKDEQLNFKYVSVSQAARLRLKDGETVHIKDLVYSSLIGSTNNTVESLVRVSGLSRVAFIARMNKQVKSWGATQTHFEEPTGLSVNNVTTAHDYAIIAREAFLDPLIASATIQSSYSFTTINTKVYHTFKNTDGIATAKNSGLLGSKTGYLVEAGHCLVTKWPTTANKNVIIVILDDSSSTTAIADTKTLLAFAQKHI